MTTTKLYTAIRQARRVSRAKLGSIDLFIKKIDEKQSRKHRNLGKGAKKK